MYRVGWRVEKEMELEEGVTFFFHQFAQQSGGLLENFLPNIFFCRLPAAGAVPLKIRIGE